MTVFVPKRRLHPAGTCQSCSLQLFTGTHPAFRGIAQRPSVVGSTFRCFVNLTLRYSMDSLYLAFIHTKPG